MTTRSVASRAANDAGKALQTAVTARIAYHPRCIWIDLPAKWSKEEKLARLGHIEARIAQLRAGGSVFVAWRQNVGATKTESRFIQFGLPGQGDIAGICYSPNGEGRHVEIECKANSGQQTPYQAAWERVVTGAGGVYRVVRSVDDIDALLAVLFS